MKTYKLRWKEWTTLRSGQPPVTEDFVPYSDTRCLVTSGSNYRALNLLIDASYEFVGDELLLGDPHVKKSGYWLRLGHKDGDDIVYSDGWEGPHQPFQHESGNYFTFEGALYRDGEVYVEPWNGYTECGNAWVADGLVYFEALKDGFIAPNGWEIWWRSVDNGNGAGMVCEGANPCIYNGKLYYCIWKDGKFEYAIKN